MISKDLSKSLIEILEVLIVVFALSWFVNTYIFGFAQVKHNGMLPTLGHNDQVLMYKSPMNNFSSLKRGDIVVFSKDTEPENSINRVIGLAGEKIEIRNGFTYINGKPIYEPYAYTPITNDFNPTIVPRNHVFVLNDNRLEKNDSRTFGSIPQEDLIGKAIFRYWPWTKIKGL